MDTNKTFIIRYLLASKGNIVFGEGWITTWPPYQNENPNSELVYLLMPGTDIVEIDGDVEAA